MSDSDVRSGQRADRRLRVLFVTSLYPTRDNPVAGVFVREHARAVQLYDDVVLVHLAGPRNNLPGWWQLSQDTDEALTQGIPTYRLWHRRSPIPKTSLLMSTAAMAPALRALARQGFRPDMVHANVYTSAVAVLPAAKLPRIPLVLTEHSTAFPRRLLRAPHKLLARWAFARASIAMPVSEDLVRAITEYGIQGRFRVIPNVVDVSLFHPRNGGVDHRAVKHLLFVGLLDPSHKKGVPVLLEALADLRRSRTDWHLDVVGDGPARQGYEQVAANLGIADRVTFHGLRSKQEVARFMQEADVFVLPSLWENLPCVIIEALASGLPIVSTTAGGIPEIVDAESGILVPPGEAAALTRTLDQMLNTLHQYDRHAIARKAGRFSPEVVGAAIDRVYREVLKISLHEPFGSVQAPGPESVRAGSMRGDGPCRT